MADSNRRDHIEQLLKVHLRNAEKEVSSDPKLKQMISKLRELYLHDKEDFLTALSPNPPEPKNQPNLPQSKIPHLIMLIDELGKKTPNIAPISPQKPIAPPSPLVNNSQTFESEPDPKLSTGQLKRQIEKITVEINKAKEVFEKLKEEEPAIESQQGKYAIPHERLKCQRLIREIPGRIHYLTDVRNQLEEEMKERLNKSR